MTAGMGYGGAGGKDKSQKGNYITAIKKTWNGPFWSSDGAWLLSCRFPGAG